MQPNTKSHLAGILLLVIATFGWVTFHRAGEQNAPRDVTIPFESGANIDAGAQEHINVIVAAMTANPDFKALIKGHTNTWGSADANLALSQSRADIVADKLRGEGIDAGRITAVGVGGQEPAPKEEGEGRLSYQRSLSRVTVSLQIR